MKANDSQIGGSHYTGSGIQPWDYTAYHRLDAFSHSVVKYVARWKDKGGVMDLQKAVHFVDKLLELNGPEAVAPPLRRFFGGEGWRIWRMFDETSVRNKNGNCEVWEEFTKDLDTEDAAIIWCATTWRTHDDLDVLQSLLARRIAQVADQDETIQFGRAARGVVNDEGGR